MFPAVCKGEGQWFFFWFVSLYPSIALTTAVECTLPKLLYLGKETMIQINTIISNVIRECWFIASSNERLGSISMQWELLLHSLGTYSVESLL